MSVAYCIEIRHRYSQTSVSISPGDGRAVNHEVRKRVVREFGLPDVAVEVLRRAPKNTTEDFPGSQESLLLSQCSYDKVCRRLSLR